MGLKMGRLMTVKNKLRKFGSNSEYKIMKFELDTGKEVYGAFTEFEINRAIKRAGDNPEDIVKTGWLRDLLD